MLRQEWLFFIVFVSITNIFNTDLFSSKQSPQPPKQQPTGQQTGDAQIQRVVNQTLTGIKHYVDYAVEASNGTVERANQALILAHNSNKTSIEAHKKAKDALDLANQASTLADKVCNFQTEVDKQTQAATEKLEHEYERLRTTLVTEIIKAGGLSGDSNLSLEDRIQLETAKINVLNQAGVYEQREKIRAQARINAKIETEKEKWQNIKEIINNSKPIIKISAAIILVALCVYAIKYGTPMLTDYLTQPHVVIETSKPKLFEWFKQKQNIDLNDLTFVPNLQKQLLDLLLRVQFAKKYDDCLPNVLFYGAPGTGKTAFVRALAYTTGLDYALTSGSEFAKITNLNKANNELRKLLNWSKCSKNGLIVFIDEAESLFANRKLPTTSKNAQDFVNTFLALIQDQSQKKVMFIFATNHPFKLDDAIINRIGTSIEFTLPTAIERKKILLTYLFKYAQENKNAIVEIPQNVKESILKYADNLEGFSPRAIKFIAEEMIIQARYANTKQLTNDIVQTVISTANQNFLQANNWEKERMEWANG